MGWFYLYQYQYSNIFTLIENFSHLYNTPEVWKQNSQTE
jgi:hypothetical protein